MYFRIFLTGQDEVRKQNLMLRSLSKMRLLAGGFVLSIFEDRNEENMALLTPGEVITLPLEYNIYQGSIVKEDGIWNEEFFGEQFSDMLEKGEERNTAFFLGMNCDIFNKKEYEDLVLEFLKKDIVCAGTINETMKAENIDMYNKICQILMEDEKSCLLCADDYTDDELMKLLYQWEEIGLDWAQHHKFDPLARPRFRTGRKN